MVVFEIVGEVLVNGKWEDVDIIDSEIREDLLINIDVDPFLEEIEERIDVDCCIPTGKYGFYMKDVVKEAYVELNKFADLLIDKYGYESKLDIEQFEIMYDTDRVEELD